MRIFTWNQSLVVCLSPVYNLAVKSNDGNEYICGVVSEFADWCEADQQGRWKILPEPRTEIQLSGKVSKPSLSLVIGAG